MKQLSDIALLNLLSANDDRFAFNELYMRYWEVIYDVSCKKLRNEDTARDVVHDLFVDIWNKRHVLEIHSSFAGYLYTMLNNKLIDLHRKWAYQSKVEAEMIRSTEPFEETVFENFTCDELEKQLWAEVGNMPSGMRQIFMLSRHEELSTQEIADRLSISPQTVKNQISNAIRRLRLKEFHL